MPAAWTDNNEIETLPGLGMCVQCKGDVLRYHEGGKDVLRCGTCGWPQGQPLPPQPPAVVSADSQLAAARNRVAELEAENAQVRAENAHLRQGAAKKSKQATAAGPASGQAS